jgi:hypothetical protein
MDRRRSDLEGKKIAINGAAGSLVDLSAGGAKVACSVEAAPGDFVNIDLPEKMGKVWGWVLDISPSEADQSPAMRIQFESPLSRFAR